MGGWGRVTNLPAVRRLIDKNYTLWKMAPPFRFAPRGETLAASGPIRY